MVKVVFFNGPPGSGKDTISNMVSDHLSQSCRATSDRHLHQFVPKQLKAAEPLKRAVHATFGRVYQEFQKEIPQDELLGMTPRKMYITFSERMFKPVFGENFFGSLLAQKIIKLPSDSLVLISDCGFQSEVEQVVKAVGEKSCILVRLHREGCDFLGDSRGYVSYPSIVGIDIENNGSKERLLDTVLNKLETWLNIIKN